jgi:phosphoribosylformimino-5-aminoimidazole carboxamide ribotide isomerase
MSPAQPATPRPVRIIPVLDLMNGQVVRAVGGRREMYRPVESRLTDSTDPLTVAEVLLSTSGAGELYVADIDAIRHLRPRLGWVRQVAARGCRVLIDSGIRTAADANAVVAAGASAVVAGTETVAGFAELKKLCATFGPEKVVLSLDLRNGRLVGDESLWGGADDPLGVVGGAVAVGVRQVLVLDLARVGTGIGTGTEVLCGRIRASFPDVELIAGGGVRTWDDVDRLGAVGVNAVLVASGLHDGTLTFPRPTS